MWHVRRWGGANNMHPLSSRGTNEKDPLLSNTGPQVKESGKTTIIYRKNC